MREIIDPQPCLKAPSSFKAGVMFALAFGFLAFAPASSHAQQLPLEIQQDLTRHNLASTNGLPISSTAGTPPGSDGRAPTIAQQQDAGLTTTPATPGQFQSAVSVGALAVPGRTNLNPSLNYARNADNLNLPRAEFNGQLKVMTRARVGSPYFSQRVSFLFGQVIPLPEKDLSGEILSGAPSDYWLAQPYTTTGHTNTGYYWSPHARSVFAIQPGPLEIVWRRAQPGAAPAGTLNAGTVTVDGADYAVLTNRYVVSGSPARAPRKMYWTEKSFRSTGKPVTVPPARIRAVNVVYNNNFPERAATEYEALGDNPIVEPGTNTLQELRTLWYDSSIGAILAYNVEGRAFLELLGDQRPDQTYQHLGFEIVDVIQQPNPDTVAVELGELLTAYQDGQTTPVPLFPEPLLQVDQSFAFRHGVGGSDRFDFYATKETSNQNDYQVHWLEEGLEGLRWPFRLVRYRMYWPVEVEKYTHYMRPLVANAEEAAETAVALPTQNAPFINYQDPLDRPRAKLTEQFAYYTHLEPEFPAHRGLLRFTAGENIRFERVFSWLDEAVKANQFAGTVATNLSSFSSETGGFAWPPGLAAPRVANVTVNVGDRILAPGGEIGGGSDTNYLAGHIIQRLGTSFHPGAYVDPFTGGFETANRGAIIPVNAIPGENHLEVWWFRKNQVDLSRGFQASHWPAVIGRYTLQWPSNPAEIVLASNDGSGPLVSLQASGGIYFQNDRDQPGYNPNEEHALMQGGQAFALRDDLNVIAGDDYTSDPFVLLDYTESDGRPAIRPFKVLREKPGDGITFNYALHAGTILQPPMPLPLLEKPLAPRIAGDPPRSLNREYNAWAIADSAKTVADDVAAWELTTEDVHYFPSHQTMALQDPADTQLDPVWFLSVDTTDTRLNGFVVDARPVGLTPYGGDASANANARRYALGDQPMPALNATVVVVDTVDRAHWLGTVTETNSALEYVEVDFDAPIPAAAGATLLAALNNDGASDDFNGLNIATEVAPPAITDSVTRNAYAKFTLQDRKGSTWIYRGPHDPVDAPLMVMKYYYRTLPGFYFPSLALDEQPAVGTITPYLRHGNFTDGFLGDPVYGNAINPNSGDENALGVVYRPKWPDDVPVLQMAETLTTPKRGLPAVRGQRSVEVVYQQSHVAAGLTHDSVVVHDATREKQFALADEGTVGILSEIPGSVKTETYRGMTYFPNLPPHLVERLFLDPNRGAFGALVFKGEFVDAPVGDTYLMLNVAGQKDLEELKALCLADDEKKEDWDNAIDGLSTALERFVEDPGKPGTYIPGPTALVGVTELAALDDDDIAVDSYALTATGPGNGYVTLIAGNGRAFTPEGEPVTVQILRVSDVLYRGEVNIVESSNPLNERITLQQVVDLAGRTEEYEFEWKIAAPVDGLPPVVYQNTPATLLGNGNWDHVPFPAVSDTPPSIQNTPVERVVQDVTTTVAPINRLPYTSVTAEDGKLRFTVAQAPRVSTGYPVVVRATDGRELPGTVHPMSTGTDLYVQLVDAGLVAANIAPAVLELHERAATDRPQSIVFREFIEPPSEYSQYWLSLELDNSLGARVYLDGQLVATANMGAEDTPTTTPAGGLNALSRVYRLNPSALAGGVNQPDGGKTHRIAVELFSGAQADAFLAFNARLEAYEAVDVTEIGWLPLAAERFTDGLRAVVGGAGDVQSLGDNYLIMRYRATNPEHASFDRSWSQWTAPQIAEGWIKRVLKGINPFNQRITDLFNNAVNTDVSLVQQAGQRWEGDIALNLDSINDYGLIEIYETVLGRGRMLSIDAGINYGPANDALLLAAGYINDLYMIVGNEALADAANPTIGIGTKDSTYGDIATALFSFRGQLPSLLDEELSLLRGRDDFLLPGVELRPVYNRLIWNYTRGIDAGEVVYALNYNVLDQNTDGVVDADDARMLFPQGHGDAYGHYLTALKGYYSLLLNENFDWVPRIEAVTVLGKPVSVDYLDERKFAGAAAALARAGKQAFDLTWRKDYRSGEGVGWEHFAATKLNTTTRNIPVTRYWGADHWASRTGQGAYLNWVAGNAILPDEDPDPSHLGTIQQVDRTTVLELQELVAVTESLQTAMDNAENGSNPLGLPESTVPFDLNPNVVVSSSNETHFEQIYNRAKAALNNALVAFDDAKDVTRLMRSEQDSLADFRAALERQELAYTNALIEIYGTPYPDDIGPGKTYTTGYAGPDLLHFSYIDNKELTFGGLLTPETDYEWIIDTQTFTPTWLDDGTGISSFGFIERARTNHVDGTPPSADYLANTNLYVSYTLDSHGFFHKPDNWTGRRASPGKLQQAISEIVQARNAAYTAFYWADAAKYDLDWAIQSFEWKKNSHREIRDLKHDLLVANSILKSAQAAWDIADKILAQTKDTIHDTTLAVETAIPTSLIAGLAAGGDLTAPIRGTIKAASSTAESVISWVQVAGFSVIRALDASTSIASELVEFEQIAPEEWNQDLRDATGEIRNAVYGVNNFLMDINAKLQQLDDAHRRFQSLIAEGERIQYERGVNRQRTAAVIQGYRTRDAAFRIFRNEKLERYKTLFDLASQYAFMAAQAYDYETGLLGDPQGREFINRIVRSRALGVVQNGEPQFAGSNTGDPGLSSAMAEMRADWLVVKGRLGFNNPDAYGTTVSLRSENYRIMPGDDGLTNWRDVLNQARRANLLDDADVRRYGLQLDPGNGLPVPGLVFEFSTTIADGLNLFGRPLAAGDHAFSPASFATKIFAAGVALEGYVGMDDSPVTGSPSGPTVTSSDPNALAATPYIYLIPVGVDSMRAPPLGDSGTIRTWRVNDVAIPLPFNIGGSDFSTAELYQSADSLTEDAFAIRKHQAFRPVSSASVFSPSIYTGTGGLQRSQFTNNRLVGRSVWNSRWKIVIPGKTLLNNPDEGLERFLRTVEDVKLHFVTYSYSGN